MFIIIEISILQRNDNNLIGLFSMAAEVLAPLVLSSSVPVPRGNLRTLSEMTQ